MTRFGSELDGEAGCIAILVLVASTEGGRAACPCSSPGSGDIGLKMNLGRSGHGWYRWKASEVV
jgi:hypothetical protein